MPAHSSWIGEVPGTGRSSTTGRGPAGRSFAGHVTSLGRAAAGSSTPSRRCRVRGHSSSSPTKSCEITTTVRPVSRRRSLEQPQQAALAGGVQPGQRLVEDQCLRRAGQQSGQHHPAHLAAAELVDAPPAPARRPDRPSASAAVTRARSSGEKPAAEATSRSTRLRISCSRAAWNAIATSPTCSGAGRPRTRQVPVVGVVRPGHDPGQGGLSGPVAAVDQHAVTLVDGEADIAQRGLGPRGAAGVFVADAVELEHRLVRRAAPRSTVGAGAAALSTMSVLSSDSLRLTMRSADVGLVVVVGDVHQRHPVALGQAGQHAEQRLAARAGRPCW